jgi:hypothetical protein
MNRKSTETMVGNLQCFPEMHLLSAGAEKSGVNSEEGKGRKIPARRSSGKNREWERVERISLAQGRDRSLGGGEQGDGHK